MVKKTVFLILLGFLFGLTSCQDINFSTFTTINFNLDLSKIVKSSRIETSQETTEYILKIFAYEASAYKAGDEIENLVLLSQTENKVGMTGQVKSSLDIEIGLNVIFVGKLYEDGDEKPFYSGNSEVVKIKATDNKVHLVLKRENTDLEINIEVHEHIFAEEWSCDGTCHWYACNCGEKKDESKHTFVNEVCTICNYSRIPKGFVFVKGTTITGSESWIPSSETFVSGRQLTIPDLLVSDHEVTRGEYKSVMGIDPSTAVAYDKEGNELTGDAVLNNPVNYVNWYDALVYCNKLSMNENLTPCYSIAGSTNPEKWGEVPTSINTIWDAAKCNFEANGYRLATEVEWELLARGGENYTYAGSNTVDDVAWYTDNTNDTGTREVKTKAPNGYGLYDMSGNEWEWCWDLYGSIASTSASDCATSGSYRVVRGGSWYDYDFDASVSLRSYSNSNTRSNVLGIRVVRLTN